jgi:hypothetical protein
MMVRYPATISYWTSPDYALSEHPLNNSGVRYNRGKARTGPNDKRERAEMPKSQEVAEVEDAAQTGGYSYEEFVAYGEAEVVHVEAADQLVFDTVGDRYIGIYAGHELIYPDAQKGDTDKFFVQLKWTDPQGAKFANAGYELRNAYVEVTYDSEGRPTVTDKIPVGSMTYNELMKLVDVDQASEMKSFRVIVARPRNADNPA